MKISEIKAGNVNAWILCVSLACSAAFVASGMHAQLLIVQDIAFGLILLAASGYDVVSRRIPNACIIAALALRAAYFALLASSGALPTGQIASSLAGAAAITFGLCALGWVAERVIGRPAIGMGDIKLFGVAGFYFGLWQGLAIIMASCALGIISARAHVFGAGDDFPFAPVIAVACITAMALKDVIVPLCV